ncbi:hypothetical protein MLD38_033571 [Melastoma candidum]|uniref:Uncharacterized protein n=1 Tax=Melastoma candidum TaxID=119954 RepID=A0ACB9M9T9_9MYRT|nr:hypothetical protein MLD38_033571 [Melastoma candidum]
MAVDCITENQNPTPAPLFSMLPDQGQHPNQFVWPDHERPHANSPRLHVPRAQRKPGEHCGYASSFTGRFQTKLPWKETLSFNYSAEEDASNCVEDYLVNTMGDQFKQFGRVYQEYCDA